MRAPTNGAVVAIVGIALALGSCNPAPEVSAGAPAEPSSAERSSSADSGSSKPAEHRRPRPLPPAEWVVGGARGTFLTFDGAPGAGTLARVTRALRAAKAPAVFFLPGRWVDSHPKEARRLLRRGHVLGNRGYETRAFTKMDPRRIRRSIRRAETAIAGIGGNPRPYLRVPKGRRDRRVLAVAGRLRYRSVRWTINPAEASPRAVVRHVRGRIRPGAIISLDLWRKSHVRAVPGILDELDARRLVPRSLDRLQKTHPVRWDIELTPGWKGDVVRRVQRLLNASTYPAGEPDGTFGTMTLHAVYAFQKVHGLERDGRLSPEEVELIALSGPPEPPRADSGSYVDVDLTRQVLFEVDDGKVVHTYPISSGSGEYYVSEGETRIASTPDGDFLIERKIPGWRVSDLGELYYPSYFYGGYAIHGSPSVPAYPASHGCIRIPMHVAEEFYSRNSVGTPVFIHG